MRFLDNDTAGRRSRGRSVALEAAVCPSAVIAVCAAALVSYVAFDWYHQYVDTAYLNSVASDGIVLGTTPAQAVGILGKPDDEVVYADGSRELTFHHGESYMKVMFKAGVATGTMRWIP